SLRPLVQRIGQDAAGVIGFGPAEETADEAPDQAVGEEPSTGASSDGATEDGAQEAEAANSDTGDPGITDQPVVVDAQIENLILGDDRVVNDVRGVFSYDGKRWNSISLSGTAEDSEREDETPVSIRYSRAAADGRNFWASATNFGTLLNALNVTDQVFGGELALSAFLDIEGDTDRQAPLPAIRGDVKMTSYRVVRAPAMAQLLVALSLNGLQGELEGEGILFNGLEADFTFDEGMLTVIDGNTGGSGLGLTLEGTIDTGEQQINMDGTIVPIRGINRLLGQVPVIGELFGGRNEGVFAFTYKVRGPLSDPQASVNPLSVLAPGVLREIFRFDPVTPSENFPAEPREPIGETN
ncbi:MAG: AsmA-like C-terminal region-containing protein, partial [Pseudomonadota bacterium]